MKYTHQTIIDKFTSFFKKNGHILYPPASLISENDNTVLFTTAGMQQFKDFYQNPEKSKNKNIITIQPCLRTSDIDEVGDNTHLSSFVMLGNFSFGGYDKEKAIKLAWEFLTSKDGLGVEKERISATYFSGDKSKHLICDNESKDILDKLKSHGLSKITPHDIGDNFWTLGTDDSPAGPTVEFYIDGVEVWNLVFNQYRLVNGKFESVDSLGVDTGLGVERLEMVLNGYENVNQSDYYSQDKLLLDKLVLSDRDRGILLDHLRTIRYLLQEGLIPSNKDRGYVLRRLVRRVLVILEKNNLSIAKFIDDNILANEEASFGKIISIGRKKIINIYKQNQTITAEELFNLYQSSGLQLEVSLAILKEENIALDEKIIEKFNSLYAQHQNISRKSMGLKFSGGLENKGEKTTKLHTATHLLLSALKQIISSEVVQKGSNITDERLRFDFNCDKKISDSEIEEIEKCVNAWIEKDLSVEAKELKIDEAIKLGAEGQFKDRYAQTVLVYSIKDGKIVVSCEICGGPHVKSTGELGSFKIIKLESIAKGIKRIKAIVE